MRNRRGWLAWFVPVVLVLSVAPAAAEPDVAGGNARTPAAGDGTAAGPEMVPGELLVRPLRAGKSVHGMAAGAQGSLRSLGPAGHGLERVAIDPGDDPVGVAAELERSGAVSYAQPNYIYRPSTDDTAWSELWGLDNRGQTILGSTGTADVDLDVPEAWELTRGSSSVLVAVIDTGVDTGHPDLAANISVNTAERDGLPGVDDDGNGFVDDVRGWDFVSNDASVFDNADDDFHGTHVAGTIAALADNGRGVAGVAPGVRILPLKAIGPNGGTSSQIIAAVEYATAMGADVINASFGGQTSGSDLALNAAIEESGAVFVAAAGNGGDDEVGDDSDSILVSPAGLPAANIVSVAAVDNRGRLAAFSNYGDETVDVGAPGVSIVSAWPGNRYAWMDGTSMAAPHVAGAAALVVSRYPDLGTAGTVSALLASAESNPLAALAGRTVTGGLVNAADALALAPTTGDVTAPVWPVDAAIAVGSVTTSGFRLSWPPATDAIGVVGYDVTVGDAAAVTVPGRSRDVGGLAAGTIYRVTIVARDAAGNLSAPLEGTAATAARSTASPYSGEGARTLEWACPEPVSAGYTDVAADSPHLAGIDCATLWGVFVGGEEDGLFVPAKRLSRAQLASVLVRAIEQITGEPLPVGGDSFVDIDANVHAASIEKLAALGIVGGYEGGRYRPAEPVTRAQFATMLAATYAHLADETPVGPNAFGDDERSPHRFAVDGLAALGVVAGVTDGLYQPAGVLTRAQSATMVARLLDALVEAGVAG